MRAPKMVQWMGSTSEYWITGSIAAGAAHSLAVRADSSLWTWGANDQGQLGSGTTDSRTSPAVVSGAPAFASVAGGSGHSLAVTTTGAVWSWGANDQGQLGNGSTTASLTPVQVSGLSDVVAVAAGA